MNIQQAVAQAKQGKPIRRPHWESEYHYIQHLRYFADAGGDSVPSPKSDGADGLLIFDQFPPGAFTWPYSPSVEDLVVNDWELLEEECSCVECNPVNLDQEIQVGDVFERYVCSGLRVIHQVQEVTDKYIRGALLCIMSGKNILPFVIKDEVENSTYSWTKVQLLDKTDWNYQSWVRGHARLHEKRGEYYLGLPHRWPVTGKTCKISGENLKQLQTVLTI